MSEETTMFFNGIDATTGAYSLPPMEPQQLADLLRSGEAEIDPDAGALKQWYEQYVQPGHYGIKEGHDPKNLAEAGWGILFAHDADPAVVEALRPLMDWRKEQAAAEHEHYYKEYTGGQGGFRPNDTKSTWLGRQGGSAGPADPEKVPYYLLIVGDPARIPYRFQTLLDVQYAVGRIHFDTVEEYARYAESVVAAEKQRIRLPRRATFFGVANPDDKATQLSAEHLVAPLAADLERLNLASPWEVQTVLAEEARKERLARLLGGPETPGLLFTASHGLGFPKDHPAQIRHQGALLCQDWPGPRRWQQPIPEEHYFSADDLGEDANLWGMLAFFFACYGAGTPQLDEFTQQAFKNRRAEIAPRPFIAGLPRRMLSHPRGGALAVVGHVERAWGHSFFWGKNRSLAAFESALRALADGYPVGYAFEYFNERYAEISTELTVLLEDMQFDLPVDPLEVAGKWTANNDAKNYVVLGDPAVRMMVAEEAGTPVERPVIVLRSPTDGAGSSSSGGQVSGQPGPDGVSSEPGKGSAFAVEPAAPINPAGTPEQGAGNMEQGMQEFIHKLAAFLGQAIDSAATLEVRTYTSDAVGRVSVVNGRVSGADLRAVTSIKLLGDIEQVVPLKDGEIDLELWNLHLEMVKQAQANRTELVRAAVSAASSRSRLRGGRAS